MDIAEVERIELGSVHLVVYAAMLGATVAGQLAGIVVDSTFASRTLWIPCAFSVALEAFVGARYGASRAGQALSAARSFRVSVVYSALLLAVSVPLAMWIIASRPASSAHPSWTITDALFALAALALATLARSALMVVLSPRRR
jgi:Na+-driven multidrug efflux pump